MSFRLLRRLFILAWLVMLTGSAAIAQSEPVAIPLKVRVKGTGTGTASTITLSVDGVTSAVVTFNAAKQMVNPIVHPAMEIGKTQALTVSTAGSATVSTLYVSAPPGYSFLLNGVEKKSIGVGNGSTVKVRVLPSTEGVAASAGTASEFATGQVKWGVSLGLDRNGAGIGWMWLVGTGTTSWSMFDTPEAFHLDDDHPDVFVKKVNNIKRQIGTREALVDVVYPGSYGALYELHFYNWASVNGGYVTSFSGLRSFRGLPYMVYRFFRTQSTFDRISVQKIVRRPSSGTDMVAPIERVEWASIERYGTADNYTWISYPWTKDGTTYALMRTVNSWAPVPGGHRSILETQRHIGAGQYQTETIARQTHISPAAGLPRLPQQGGTVDPAAPDQEHSAESADWSRALYHSDASLPGSFGFPSLSRDRETAWSFTQYYNPADSDPDRDKKHGVVTDVYQPWLDAGLNNDVVSPGALPYPRLHTTYAYAEDRFQMLTRPTVVQSSYEGAAGSATTLSTQSTIYTERAWAGFNVVDAVTTAQSGYGGQQLNSKRVYFREDSASHFRRNQLVSETSPNGEKVSYARVVADVIWDTDGTPYTIGMMGDDAPVSSLVVAISGYAQNPGNNTATQLSYALDYPYYYEIDGSSYTGYDLSADIDPIWVVDGKSIATYHYRDSSGKLIYVERKIFVGSEWQRLDHEKYTYNLNQQLIRREGSNGDLYEAGYVGEFKTWERDASGVYMTYDYDDAGRLLRSVKQGINGQPDLITEYGYSGDSFGRILTEKIYAFGNTELLLTTRKYDLSGRLVSEQGPNAAATNYTYAPVNRETTVQAPDGARTIQTAYVDGQPKSTVTKALLDNGQEKVVASEYFYSGIESDGRRWNSRHVGAPQSARWTITRSDGLGRVVISERPGFGGGTTYSEQSIYENFTGRLLRVNRTDMAPTLYGYNAYGEATVTALSVNDDGVIDYGGSDRISGSESYLEWEPFAQCWWAVTRQYAYLTANSASPTTLGSTRRRVTGFTGNLRAETRSIDAEGNVSTSLTYVNRGTRTVTTSQTAPGLASAATTTAINGLAVSTTAPDGLTTTTGYDHLGRLVTVTDARDRTYRTSYKQGTTLVDTRKDARGIIVASYDYDPSGRVIATRDHANKASYVSYDATGAVSRQWGDTATPVSYEYDGYGQRIKMNTYRGGSGWSSIAWPTPTTGNADTTTWEYDAWSGLLKKKTDALGRSVEYTYNTRGQPLTRTWARTIDGTVNTSRITATYTYDAATADPTGTTYNDGTIATSIGNYDRSGRPLSRGDATGTRTFAYDGSKPWRFAGEYLPSYFGSRVLRVERWETTNATAAGWGPHTYATVKGAEAGYSLGGVAPAESSRDLRVAYFAANTGRLAGLQSFGPGGGDGGSGGFHYTYTANSRLVAGLHANSLGYSLNRAYESQRDLLTHIDTKWGTGTRVSYDYQYDNRSRRTAAIQAGDTFEADYGGPLRTDYDYDDRDQLESADTYLAAGSADWSNQARPLPGRRHGYAYDTMGNRTSSSHERTDPNNKSTYLPNELNQYTSRTNTGVPYRGVAAVNANVAVDGQAPERQERYFWKDVEFGAGAGAQGKRFPIAAALPGGASGGADAAQIDYRVALFAGATESFQYDLDGNLIEDGTWFYGYDAENRLIRMERKAWTAFPGSPPRYLLEFTYDYQGRRVGKKVFHADSTGNWQLQKETRFIYDGWNLIAEIDGAAPAATGSLLRSYAWGLDLVGSRTASGGVGALVQIWDHVKNERYLPGYDGNGNVAALFNATNGVLVAAYEYGPFGEAIRVGGSGGADNPFRFSTKYTDVETGLVYYGYRYYDAKNGRFINRDPIEERGGLNLYGFCGNDGINHWDYLGQSWLSKAWKKVKKWMGKHKWAAIAIGAVAGFFTGGAVLGALQGINNILAGAIAGAVGGFVAGATTTALMGGNLGQVFTAGAWGALGGAVAGGIGGYFGHGVTGQGGRFAWAQEARRALAHGLSQGGIAELRGGKFGAGFASGLFSSYAGSALQFAGVPWQIGVPTGGVIGGLSSRIAGGRFEDGLASGLVVSAFNHYLEAVSSREKIEILRRGMKLRERIQAAQDSFNGEPIPISSAEIEQIAEVYALEKNISGETGFLANGQGDSFFYNNRFGEPTVGGIAYRLDGGGTVYGADINYFLQGVNTYLRGQYLDDAYGRVGLWLWRQGAKYDRVVPFVELGYRAAGRVISRPIPMEKPGTILEQPYTGF